VSYHFSLASPRSVRAERQPVGPNETGNAASGTGKLVGGVRAAALCRRPPLLLPARSRPGVACRALAGA